MLVKDYVASLVLAPVRLTCRFTHQNSSLFICSLLHVLTCRWKLTHILIQSLIPRCVLGEHHVRGGADSVRGVLVALPCLLPLLLLQPPHPLPASHTARLPRILLAGHGQLRPQPNHLLPHGRQVYQRHHVFVFSLDLNIINTLEGSVTASETCWHGASFCSQEMISARTALSLEWGLSGGAVMGRDPTSASDIKETLGLAVLKVSPAWEECKSRIW